MEHEELSLEAKHRRMSLVTSSSRGRSTTFNVLIITTDRNYHNKKESLKFQLSNAEGMRGAVCYHI